VSGLDVGFEQLLEYVRDSRGFDYTGYRRSTLMRRFEKRMQAVGADDWEAYRTYLGDHPQEYDNLFNAILINVTGFFRDRETWDVVATDVIPRLLESKDQRVPIRVWSAGCASGEEPYTMVMLLVEALGEDAFKQRVKMYATDVDEEALTQARDATYTSKQLEHVPPRLRETYFQVNGNGFSFRKDLRRYVIFGRNDLLRDPPISKIDALISRNTLMYFSSEIQERILSSFSLALNRGGFLVVGRAEALQSGRRLFNVFDVKRRIFVKDGSTDLAFLRMPQPPERDTADDDVERGELSEAAFEHAPIAQMIVDEQSDVIAINQPARSMFGLKLKDIGRPLQDLDISYKPVELRSLIGEASEKLRVVSAKNVRWITAGDDPRSFDVQVSPLIAPADRVIGVSIAFADVTSHRSLEEHLETARRELETAYEELQSTVEELATTNEELQSTNEEIETTNEELQSTNEELETMNEELQSTNEELETMIDELRERTDETMRANAFLGSVLSGIQQAVVVVDRELRVIAWNRLATNLWGLRDDEVEGEHLLNLDIGMPLESMREPVRRVLSGDEQPDLELAGHDRRGHAVTYSAAFAPLLGDLDNAIFGAIVLVAAERMD